MAFSFFIDMTPPATRSIIPTPTPPSPIVLCQSEAYIAPPTITASTPNTTTHIPGFTVAVHPMGVFISDIESKH